MLAKSKKIKFNGVVDKTGYNHKEGYFDIVLYDYINPEALHICRKYYYDYNNEIIETEYTNC